MPNNQVVILSILLLVGFLFMWSRCALSCKKSAQEMYQRRSLTQSSFGAIGRTPVDTAFKGDGMEHNPHYMGSPTDKLVPLEYGGDFYKDSRKSASGQMFDELDEGYRAHDFEGTHLINDSKTRADMIDSGDMGWWRVLSSMKTNLHAQDPAAGPVEGDFAVSPSDYSQGLYHPSYHRDHIGN